MNKRLLISLLIVVAMCISMVSIFAAAPTVTATYDVAAKKVTVSGTATSSQVEISITREGIATPDYYMGHNTVDGSYSVLLSWSTKPIEDYTVTVKNLDDDTTATTTFTTKDVVPTAAPTAVVTAAPTAVVTAAPTAEVTAAPTAAATVAPTAAATVAPTAKATAAPNPSTGDSSSNDGNAIFFILIAAASVVLTATVVIRKKLAKN